MCIFLFFFVYFVIFNHKLERCYKGVTLGALGDPSRNVKKKIAMCHMAKMYVRDE
jgi:hypothetical protein